MILRILGNPALYGGNDVSGMCRCFLVLWGGGLYLFIYTTLINMAVGSGLILLGRGAENRVTRRDGYCIVAFTWLLFTGSVCCLFI